MSFISRVGALAVTFFQDFFAVIFQPVCLSRLGTKDYYDIVHENVDENGTATPSVCRIDSTPSYYRIIGFSTTNSSLRKPDGICCGHHPCAHRCSWSSI